jgi:hypothetical protein
MLYENFMKCEAVSGSLPGKTGDYSNPQPGSGAGAG